MAVRGQSEDGHGHEHGGRKILPLIKLIGTRD